MNRLAGFRTLRISFGRCSLEYMIQKDHPGLPWMVFFHGFGQDSRAFETLFPVFQQSYNLISIHLYYHGESWVEGKNPLKKEEWLENIRLLLEREQVPSATFLAYSMGAKFALVAASELPEKVEQLILLAPDGLVMNPWYRFAAKTRVGRTILSVSTFWMPVLQPLFLLISKLGLVKQSLARFAMQQMATREQRKQVVRVWLMFRNIWPDNQKMTKLLSSGKLSVRLVLGKHDAIIRVKTLEPVRKKWPQIEWLILDCGHASLVEKLAKSLTNKTTTGN